MSKNEIDIKDIFFSAEREFDDGFDYGSLKKGSHKYWLRSIPSLIVLFLITTVIISNAETIPELAFQSVSEFYNLFANQISTLFKA